MRKIFVFMLLVLFAMAYIYWQGAADAPLDIQSPLFAPEIPQLNTEPEFAPRIVSPDRSQDIFMPVFSDSAVGETSFSPDATRYPKTRMNRILLLLLSGWLAGWLLLRFRNELAYGLLVLSIMGVLVFLTGILDVRIDATRLNHWQMLVADALSGMGLPEFFSLVMGLLIGGSGGSRRPRTPRKAGRKLLDMLRL